MSGYEDLAAEIIAAAIKDYIKLKNKTDYESLLEKRKIEKFLLSEKYNFSDISGKETLKAINEEKKYA